MASSVSPGGQCTVCDAPLAGDGTAWLPCLHAVCTACLEDALEDEHSHCVAAVEAGLACGHPFSAADVRHQQDARTDSSAHRSKRAKHADEAQSVVALLAAFAQRVGAAVARLWSSPAPAPRPPVASELPQETPAADQTAPKHKAPADEQEPCSDPSRILLTPPQQLTCAACDTALRAPYAFLPCCHVLCLLCAASEHEGSGATCPFVIETDLACGTPFTSASVTIVGDGAAEAKALFRCEDHAECPSKAPLDVCSRCCKVTCTPGSCILFGSHRGYTDYVLRADVDRWTSGENTVANMAPLVDMLVAKLVQRRADYVQQLGPASDLAQDVSTRINADIKSLQDYRDGFVVKAGILSAAKAAFAAGGVTAETARASFIRTSAAIIRQAVSLPITHTVSFAPDTGLTTERVYRSVKKLFHKKIDLQNEAGFEHIIARDIHAVRGPKKTLRPRSVVPGWTGPGPVHVAVLPGDGTIAVLRSEYAGDGRFHKSSLALFNKNGELIRLRGIHVPELDDKGITSYEAYRLVSTSFGLLASVRYRSSGEDGDLRICRIDTETGICTPILTNRQLSRHASESAGWEDDDGEEGRRLSIEAFGATPSGDKLWLALYSEHNDENVLATFSGDGQIHYLARSSDDYSFDNAKMLTCSSHQVLLHVSDYDFVLYDLSSAVPTSYDQLNEMEPGCLSWAFSDCGHIYQMCKMVAYHAPLKRFVFAYKHDIVFVDPTLDDVIDASFSGLPTQHDLVRQQRDPLAEDNIYSNASMRAYAEAIEELNMPRIRELAVDQTDGTIYALDNDDVLSIY